MALIAGAVIGYLGAGYQYSAQLDKAKKMFPVQPNMSVISGTVKSISGNTITLQTQPSMNPFEDLPTVREVSVTSATKIVKNELKDPKVYQQEMADYQAAFQTAQKAAAAAGGKVPMTSIKWPITPMPSVETAVKISDIKAGDMLMVDAGKDVKMSSSFEAVKITVTGAGAPIVPAGASAAPGAAPAPTAVAPSAVAPAVKTAPAQVVVPNLTAPPSVPAKK